MKKNPMNRYQKQTGEQFITAEMAAESRLRRQKWINHGCNAYDLKKPKSTPMAFWTEQDVLHYIKRENLPIASVYGGIEYIDQPDQMRMEECTGCSIGGSTEKLHTTGCDRTGCVFCAYGAHLERGESRFQRLVRTHPKLYDYCIGGGEWARRRMGKWSVATK